MSKVKTKHDDIFPEFLSTGTIAKKLDRSGETIRREIKAGRLKAYNFRGEFLVKIEDYEEWKSKFFKPVA